MNLSELNRRLVANAFLFDDPRAYAAGVSDALDAVRRLLEWDGLLASEPAVLDLAQEAPTDAVIRLGQATTTR